jgi:hypothetical protein
MRVFDVPLSSHSFPAIAAREEVLQEAAKER